MSKAPPRGRGRARRAPQEIVKEATSSDEAVTVVPEEPQARVLNHLLSITSPRQNHLRSPRLKILIIFLH